MLKINNIRVTVDNKEVVKGVSLEIRPGEIHALMGPNGSGKSSLAMAIAGHPKYQIKNQKSPPQADRPLAEKIPASPAGRKNTNQISKISFNGIDISDKTPDERARMGLFLAMQYPVGVGGVTPEQLLRRAVQEIKNQPQKESSFASWSPSTPAKSDPSGFGRSGDFSQSEKSGSSEKLDVLQFRKDLEKLAKKVGVKPELIRRSLNVGFSGGEKKRLEILQMLVLKPKYAILDETDSGLDIDALRMIAAAIKNYVSARSTKLVARGNQRRATSHEPPAALVITHYARLLHHLKPDFVHIMKEGKITETGKKELAERIEKKGYL